MAALLAARCRSEPPSTLARLAERCPATPIMVASLRPYDEDALYETSRGFLLPDEWDPAPLLRGATTWKKHKRKPPSLDADGRVVEVAGELSATEKAAAFAVAGGALFVVAPLLVQGRDLKRIYDYSRTEEILKDSRDAGRASSAAASRSLKTSVQKWLGFDN